MRTTLLSLVVLAIGLIVSILTDRSAPSRSPAIARTDIKTETASPDATSPLNDNSTELDRNADGYFYADVDVNGVKVHMLVDTGANGVALSLNDARAAGIATSIGMNDPVGEGPDGSVYGDKTSIDRMSFAGKTVEDLPAIVLRDGNRSLLGQSFLNNFDSIVIHGNIMTLR